MGRPDALLELTCAVRAAALELRRRPRARLETALAGFLAAERRPSREQALEQLRAALAACRAAGVDWPQVVAIVNREG